MGAGVFRVALFNAASLAVFLAAVWFSPTAHERLVQVIAIDPLAFALDMLRIVLLSTIVAAFVGRYRRTNGIR